MAMSAELHNSCHAYPWTAHMRLRADPAGSSFTLHLTKPGPLRGHANDFHVQSLQLLAFRISFPPLPSPELPENSRMTTPLNTCALICHCNGYLFIDAQRHFSWR